MYAAIKCIKEDFSSNLNKISSFKIEDYFVNYEKRVKQSTALYDEGIKLRDCKKYQ